MGYTTDDSMVRVDFFKQSGKWYTTEQMYWDRYSTRNKDGTIGELINETFERCLNKQFPNHFTEMIAICLEPYHEHSFPLMINRKLKR